MLIISEFNPQSMQSDDSEEEMDYQFSDATNLNQVVTYRGKIKSLYDALLIIEACRLQIFTIITRRLTGIERTKFIRPNTIFVWNETQCGMKRWTDGKLWSASKVFNGNFLIYKQLNKKTKKEEPNGLIKQSFSLVTKDNQRYHLISYYENDPSIFNKNNSNNNNNNGGAIRRIESLDTDRVQQQSNDEEVNIPSQDPKISQLQLSNSVYPDSLLNSVFKRKNQQQHKSSHSSTTSSVSSKSQSTLNLSLPSTNSSVSSPIEGGAYSPNMESTYSTSTVSNTSVSTPKFSLATPLASISRCVETKNLNDSLLPPPSASSLSVNLMKDYDLHTVSVLNKGGWLK